MVGWRRPMSVAMAVVMPCIILFAATIEAVESWNITRQVYTSDVCSPAGGLGSNDMVSWGDIMVDTCYPLRDGTTSSIIVRCAQRGGHSNWSVLEYPSSNDCAGTPMKYEGADESKCTATSLTGGGGGKWKRQQIFCGYGCDHFADKLDDCQSCLFTIGCVYQRFPGMPIGRYVNGCATRGSACQESYQSCSETVPVQPSYPWGQPSIPSTCPPRPEAWTAGQGNFTPGPWDGSGSPPPPPSGEDCRNDRACERFPPGWTVKPDRVEAGLYISLLSGFGVIVIGTLVWRYGVCCKRCKRDEQQNPPQQTIATSSAVAATRADVSEPPSSSSVVVSDTERLIAASTISSDSLTSEIALATMHESSSSSVSSDTVIPMPIRTSTDSHAS